MSMLLAMKTGKNEIWLGKKWIDAGRFKAVAS